MFNILVVDDDKNSQRLMQVVLESENYNVFTAENGIQALEVIENEHIDLVVLDVMMPEMDGYEFTKSIRSANNNLPILMVSAKQLPIDRKNGFISGTDDYMTKPVDVEEMVLRIKALLRRYQINNERKVIFKDMIFDYDTLSVTKKDEIKVLPQKEFMLLFKLVSYPGKIFTRIQIMDEIWGMDSDSGWETVTVHIARLRKRFADWPELEIEAVRGLGYRVVK